jgi:hypothetical protein
VFWIELALAIGTFLAVLVALFGKWLQGKCFAPALELELTGTGGEATLRQTPEGTSEGVRYYHVRVSNSRRWSPANKVQVVLLRVEERSPNGEFRVAWQGEIPLAWKHGQEFALERTLGHPAVADLCSVGERAGLRLHTLVTPFNLEVAAWTASDMVLTLQGQASEVDSRPLRLRVSWDGQWHAGEAEMRRHMLLQELTAKDE